MAVVKPFCAVRPQESLASKIAALPYDVYNRKEAKEETEKNPYSFLKIDRPETQFPDDTDMYAPEVIQTGPQDILEDDGGRGLPAGCGPQFLSL